MPTVSVGDSLPALLSDTVRFGYEVSQKCTTPFTAVFGPEEHGYA